MKDNDTPRFSSWLDEGNNSTISSQLKDFKSSASLPDDEARCCVNCRLLAKQLHKIHLRNIALEDDCNKMRGFKTVTNQKLKTLQAENDENSQGFQTINQQSNELIHLLDQKSALLKEATKTIYAQKSRDLELRKHLTDALNVKLRYENIIKKLVENEIYGHPMTVKEVIKTVPVPRT